ncbi:MAG: aminotransferase class V-fold PLP-dependent enzyme [Ruminococcus sp.]|nr:aminotransferase class V-fold PLP-dependent enzyme [Ruminococcus sp.]
MINFDNSATTFPKPPSVRRAVAEAVERYGGNPGRSGHELSMQAAAKIFEVRTLAAGMFGAESENTAFTVNCTFALNMAIKGMMQYGGHIIISGYEHNASARPVYALYRAGRADFSVAEVSDDTDETVSAFEKLIRQDTKCICCCIASNVTGRILPCKELADLCRRYGLCFIADCSQAAGVLDLSLSDGFDFICTSGHKALYGPTGTGLLITNGKYPLSTIIEGGTGTSSALLEQPAELPERLESGTLNTVGIIGFGEGLRFVKRYGPSAIRAHEQQLCRRLIERISARGDIRIYRSECDHVPIVAFNVGNESSHVIASRLSDLGFALRGGLHCAALAHRSLGTLEQGVVRFSPSVFNTLRQTDQLADAVLSL